MRICIVGGIFGKPEDYRRKHTLTPETILVSELPTHGVDVVALSHYDFKPSSAYDIVHVHHLAHAALRMALSKKSVFIFTGHSGPLVLGYKQNFARRAIFQYVVRQSDATVALSEFEYKYLKGITSSDTDVQLIYNGIPSTYFRPKPVARRSQTLPEILFVGQLRELKGVDILFEAFQKVVATRDAKLTLVYQHAPQEDYYRSRAQALGIADKVDFLGFLSHQELSNLYPRADLLVLPSYAEALPSVVTEALLSGIPVVATDVGGISEQVGEFGVLVQPGEAGELADAVQLVLSKLEFYREHSQDIHNYAAKRFSVEKMVQAHVRLYNSVLEQQDSRSREEKVLLSKMVSLALDSHIRVRRRANSHPQQRL